MKKTSKKNMQAFNEEVISLLEKFGATESDYYLSGGYKLETELGNYHIKLDYDSSSIYSIFGRFENVEEAKRYTNCNPYSGKHNFHTSDKDYCILQLETFLNRFAYEAEKEKCKLLVKGSFSF
jgi:hypothetical protein